MQHANASIVNVPQSQDFNNTCKRLVSAQLDKGKYGILVSDDTECGVCSVSFIVCLQ